MKVITFGEILLRLAAPGYARLFQKDSLETCFCGSEANVAVSLACFGMDSSFISKLPEGQVGQAAEDSMRSFGVDTSGILRGEGRMGIYYLEKGVSQRPSKVIYDRANSVFAMAEPREFEWNKIFGEAEWFHWSGITPALSEKMPEIILEACRVAKEKKLMISCDLNYRKKLWDCDKAQRIIKNLMPYVNVCIANEEDVEKFFGIKTPHNDVEAGKLNKQGYERVAAEICRSFGCDQTAFTFRESYSASINGWSGMLYNAKLGEAFYSNNYDINIVDRIGSGDSFAAGIIYSMLTEKTQQETIDFAVAASCLKHSIEGDYNRVTVREVENLIQGKGNGRVQR